MPVFVPQTPAIKLRSGRRCAVRATKRGIVAIIVSTLCPSVVTTAIAGVDVVDLGGGQYRVRFSYSPGEKINTVAVAGSFNGWRRDAWMEGPDETGAYSTTLVLGAGHHEYKYFVDGHRWVADPGNPEHTGPFGNSLLTLGRGDTDSTGSSSSSAAKMARTVSNPAAVNALVERLAGVKDDRPAVLAKWFRKHPQPLMDESSVSFVFADRGADRVDIEIRATDVRHSYVTKRPAADMPVYAVTLNRSDLADGAVYLIAVTRGGATRFVIDPNARSYTSRGGQPVGMIAEPSPKRGRIMVHEDVAPADGSLPPRDVYVYLPPGYDDSSDRYPVLYMHDGQNCWDDPTEPFGHGGWNANGIADKLINEGVVSPFIVVGVANTPNRLFEYGTGQDITDGAAHNYIRFLTHDLRTLINTTYRTKTGPADTALLGSSMGGSISLQASLLYPKVFGSAACMSPTFLFTDNNRRGHRDLIREVGKVEVRLYIDHGTGSPSHDGAKNTKAVVELLRETGWRDGLDLEYFVDQGAEHNERAWRARLDRPLRFLFGRKPESNP